MAAKETAPESVNVKESRVKIKLERARPGSLTSKYFIHTDSTSTCYSVGVAHLAQSYDSCLYQVVRVR